MSDEARYADTTAKVARHLTDLYAARLERACEAAVSDGRYGVMTDGRNAWVDPRVPYGMIHEVSP